MLVSKIDLSDLKIEICLLIVEIKKTEMGCGQSVLYWQTFCLRGKK
jgi:hypothetical protein